MKRLVSLLLLLSLSGCTSLLLTFNSHVVQDFQQAISQHHFQKAHDIVANLPTDHAAYAAIQKHLPELHQAEKAFTQNSLKLAHQLADDHQLQAAISLLETSRQALPKPSDKLHDALAHYKAIQQQQINVRMASLLTHQASWILTQQSSLNYLSQQPRDAHISAQANAILARSPKLATQLRDLGVTFFEQRQWQSSFHCLTLAKQLGADPFPDDKLAKALAHLDQKRQQRKQQRLQHRRHEADARISRYQTSRLISDLLAAKQYLDKLENVPGLADRIKRVEQLSKQRFQHDLQLGDSLYTSGHYRSAKRIWEQLSPLFPNNADLAKKLDRVDKVINSLHSLRQS